jgi:hypothetical protein
MAMLITLELPDDIANELEASHLAVPRHPLTWWVDNQLNRRVR